jgi:hypothetical protein
MSFKRVSYEYTMIYGTCGLYASSFLAYSSRMLPKQPFTFTTLFNFLITPVATWEQVY